MFLIRINTHHYFFLKSSSISIENAFKQEDLGGSYGYPLASVGVADAGVADCGRLLCCRNG